MKLALGRLGSAGNRTLIQRAIASLRARGTDAHLWLPGGDVRTYGAELVSGVFGSGADNTITTQTASGFTTTAGTAAARVYTSFPTVLNRTYTVTFKNNANSGGNVTLFVRDGAAGTGTVIATSASTAVGLSATVTFTPLTTTTSLLFLNGVAGVSFGCSDITCKEITSITPTITSGLTTGNYLESTGNSVATVNNPVGLVLDALGSVGAELVTNGGFADATGWTVPVGWAVGSGVAAGTATSSSLLCTQYTPVTGKTYLVTFDCTVTGGTLYVATGSGTAASFTTSGPKRCILVCGATPSRAIEWYGGAVSGSVDNISVREVTGIHLTQGTTANKPVLRRGLTNLLTYSSDFSNAAWSANAATKTAGQADPDGGTGATLLVEAVSASTGHRLVHNYTSTAGPCTVAVIAKRVTGSRNVGIKLWDGTTDRGVAFDTSAVSVVGTLTGVSAPTASSIAAIQNGFCLCALNITTAAGVGDVGAHLASGVNVDYVGDGTSSIVVYRVGVFLGTLTAAQILAAGGIPVTTTAAASNPDAGKYSWSFDSTDLLSATIPAGWESATVIDAAPTGAVASVQNVVGTHSIRGAMVTGVNLVTNGGFDSADGWTQGTGWSISDGVAVHAAGSSSAVNQSSPIESGKSYQCTVTVSGRTAGTWYWRLGNTTNLAASNSNGTITQTLTGSATGSYIGIFGDTTFDGSVDNISVYEINPVTHARILVKGTLTEAETNLYKSLANSFK